MLTDDACRPSERDMRHADDDADGDMEIKARWEGHVGRERSWRTFIGKLRSAVAANRLRAGLDQRAKP